jgi:hypothetical protein
MKKKDAELKILRTKQTSHDDPRPGLLFTG